MPDENAAPVTGRCYCGAIHITATQRPLTVAYCHCVDCKRITGAPVAAFAAFPDDAVSMAPAWPDTRSFVRGVDRWACPDCGSALAAQYDYLPGQTYVPIGVLDQADAFSPAVHAHAGSKLGWLHIDDDLPRPANSARDALNAASETGS